MLRWRKIVFIQRRKKGCRKKTKWCCHSTISPNISSQTHSLTHTHTPDTLCIKHSSACKITCSYSATIYCPPVAADAKTHKLPNVSWITCEFALLALLLVLNTLMAFTVCVSDLSRVLLTSLLWLLWRSASNAAALQAEGGVHLPCAPRRLLHLFHMSLHQLSWHLLTHTGELLCRQRDAVSFIHNLKLTLLRNFSSAY